MVDSWFGGREQRGFAPLLVVQNLQHLVAAASLAKGWGSTCVPIWTLQILVFALAARKRGSNSPATVEFLELARNSSDYGSTLFRDQDLWPASQSTLTEVLSQVEPFSVAQLIEVVAAGLDYGRTLSWSSVEGSPACSRDLTTSKMQGIFYTPVAVSEFLAQSVTSGWKARTPPRVCDPAVGSGRFLIATARRLLSKWPALEVLRTLYGVDTDPLAVELAAICLAIVCDQWSPGNPPPTWTTNLVCGDAFAGPIVGGGNADRASGSLCWDRVFPDVFAGANPGFDAVLVNPPYGRYKADSDWMIAKEMRLDPASFAGLRQRILTTRTDLRSSRMYPLSAQGVLDKARIGLERAVQITKKGGRLGALVPSTLAADVHSFRLREHLLHEWSLEEIVEFPEAARLFFDVSQSICALVASKGSRTQAVSIRTGVTTPKELTEGTPATWPLELIERMSSKLALPLRQASGADIVEMMQRYRTIGGWPNLVNARGEVDVTLYRDVITSIDTGTPLVRGDHIDRYTIDRASNKDAFIQPAPFLKRLRGSRKYNDFLTVRIAGRQCSYLYRASRLSFAVVPPERAIANSCNYLATASEEDLFYLLAFLNSELLNWRFKLSNSNNHVANSEIGELPVPMRSEVGNVESRRLAELAASATSRPNCSTLSEIDEIVYSIYRLAPEQIQRVRTAELRDRRGVAVD
jgi:Alw26I/Eco31I/Esp3I family type II restriction m6 adenine DNA methyltransferase